MGAGIITGWIILFAVLFVCKLNHIFELNITPEESEAKYHEYGATENQENKHESNVLKKSHYKNMLRRTFLMCF